MAPADAARWVRVRPPGTAYLGATGGDLRVPSPPTDASASAGLPVAQPSQRAAGEQIPLSRAVSQLLAAATRLDGDAVADALTIHLSERGVLRTWDDICVPMLTQIGQRNARLGDCVDVEHLLSWTIGGALHRVARQQPGYPGARLALLACVEDERHTLSLDALRAALAERGASVRMLGAATPSSALTAAITRSRPGAVVVWAQTGRTARPGLLAEPLAALRSEHARSEILLAGGPGWNGRRLPEGVTRVGSLHTAILLTLGAIVSPI
jgi:hypothetical protein